jgi:multidrug efflux pump subunit AcrB
MAFLGVASLIGVIVSHVIVLFDFIEEMHEKGEPLERALPDAGIERIRPVMITVGATLAPSRSLRFVFVILIFYIIPFLYFRH